MVYFDFAIHPHPLLLPNEEEYNCSIPTLEEWEQLKDPSIFRGIILLIIGIVALIIYSVVITAMTNKSILHSDCIKLLYLYCWVDCGNVAIGGLLTAVLFSRGEIFCTSPFWAFAPGALGLGFWSASCVLCISLAVNRCLVFHKVDTKILAHLVFFLTGVHFIFMTFFTRNTIFNATVGSLFYLPFIQPFDVKLPRYQNSYHLMENIVTATVTPLLYTYLSIRMAVQSRGEQIAGSTSFNKMQASVFLQSLVVCSLTSVTSVVFAYMQLFPCPEWWPFAAEVAYEVYGSIPATVILLLNTTIKQRAKAIFCQKRDGGQKKTTSLGTLNRSQIQPTTLTNTD